MPSLGSSTPSDTQQRIALGLGIDVVGMLLWMMLPVIDEWGRGSGQRRRGTWRG